MKTKLPNISLLLLTLSVFLFISWSFFAKNNDVAFVALFILGCAVYARSLGNIKQFAQFMEEVERAIQDKSTHINITKDKDD